MSGLRLRPLHRVFSKKSRGWYDNARPYLLSVENPFDPSMDVGRNSYHVLRVRRALNHARRAMLGLVQRSQDIESATQFQGGMVRFALAVRDQGGPRLITVVVWRWLLVVEYVHSVAARRRHSRGPVLVRAC